VFLGIAKFRLAYCVVAKDPYVSPDRDSRHRNRAGQYVLPLPESIERNRVPRRLYHYLMHAPAIRSLLHFGGAVSCTKQYSLEFGYITNPLLRLPFLLNFLLSPSNTRYCGTAHQEKPQIKKLKLKN
jgi:hypothetical protein